MEKIEHLDARDQISALWQDLGDDFFIRHTPLQIAKLTQDILAPRNKEPFVTTDNTRGDLSGGGATQVYIYSQDKPQLFANTVGTLGHFGMSVVDATIHTGPSGMCFDTYTVLDSEGKALAFEDPLHQRIIETLKSTIVDATKLPKQAKTRIARRLRELHLPTEVSIQANDDASASILTVIASDRPGLLATLAGLFLDLHLDVLSAKITTLGERVEDNFVIQDQHHRAVAAGQATYDLANTIRQRIDQLLAN